MQQHMSRAVASALLVTLVFSARPLAARDSSAADIAAFDREAFSSSLLVDAYVHFMSLPPSPREFRDQLVEEEVARYQPLLEEWSLAGGEGPDGLEEGLREALLAGLEERQLREAQARILANMGSSLAEEASLLNARFESGELDRGTWLALLREAGREAVMRQLGESGAAGGEFEEELFARANAWIAREALAASLLDTDRTTRTQAFADRQELLDHDLSVTGTGDEGLGDIRSLMDRFDQSVGNLQAELLAHLQTEVSADMGELSRLANDGEDWMSRWNGELDRALATWEGAAARFIARRVDWEEAASHSFSTAQEAWQEAWSVLDACRASWQQDLDALHEESLSNYQADALAVNAALETLLASMSSMQATLIAQEEAAAAEYMEAVFGGAAYTAGLEHAIRGILHTAGAREALLLPREDLADFDSSGIALSVAKKGELDALLTSLKDSLDERDGLEQVLVSLSAGSPDDTPGIVAGQLVLDRLAAWAAEREEGALALVSYRDRVARGEISRGEELPEAGSPGYSEISLWAGSPSLDQEWPDELLADARSRGQRAATLAALMDGALQAPESAGFEAGLEEYSRRLDELEGLQALAGHWARKQDLAVRDLEAARHELEAACDQWTLPQDLPTLYRDGAGRLRLLGEGEGVDPSDSLDDDLTSWVCRMEDRSFDDETLMDWALARAYILASFEEGPLADLAAGEAGWLANTVGQLVVDGVSINSVLQTYRTDTRQSLMEETWALMDEETRADIEFLTLLELGGNPIASDLNDRLRVVMEEMEFATVDACISARIEAAGSAAQNSANVTAIMMGFTMLNIYNPLGWFCGGMVALFAGATIATSVELETLHNARSSYEDEWALVVEEREGGTELFSQAFDDFALLVDSCSDLEEAALFAADPANAQEVWTAFGDSLAQEAGTMISADLRQSLVALVASILESGEGNGLGSNGAGDSGSGDLLPKDALEVAQSILSLDIDTMTNQLDALVDQRNALDFSLAEALAADAMDWVCGLPSAVNPEPYINGVLHGNSRASGEQIARFKDMRSRLAAFNRGDPSVSPAFSIPLQSLLSSTARASIGRVNAMAALERVRARTDLSCLEASQLLFGASLDELASSGFGALAEAGEALEGISAGWEQACALALEEGAAAWEAAWQEHLSAREIWLGDCARNWQDGVSGAALALVAESGCREARSLDTLLVAPAFMSVDGRSGDLAALMEDLRAELSLPTASQALYGQLAGLPAPSGDGEGAFESLLSRTLDASRAASSALVARNRRDLLALNELSSLSALEAMADSFTANLAAVNNDFDASMDELFVRENKWQRNGGMYHKDYVVHATLIDSLLYKSSEVSVYTPLLPEDCGYEGLEAVYGSDDRTAAIEGAFTHIEELFATVFGTEDEEGLLSLHIGTAPEQEIEEEGDGEVDAEGEEECPVDTEGSGELGRLIQACIDVMREEGEGWAKAAIAWYDKPIADDRSGSFAWLKSCSVRTLADVAMTIAAGACTAGLGTVAAQLATTAISLSDDILFSFADLERGSDAGAVLLNFGKKALMSVVTPAIGGGFESFSRTALESASGVVGATMNFALDASRIMTTSAVNAAISAVEWDGSSLSWSAERFGEVLNDGLPAAIVGSFTTASLNVGLEGLTGELLDNARSLSSFAGGLAGEAVRYQTDGTMSFNILDAADLTGGALNGDLLRLDIGKEGAGVSLGAGGLSAGFSTLLPALKGLEAWGLNARLLVEGGSDLSRYQSALRTLYSDPALRGEFEALLAGAVQIREDRGLDATAQSVFDEESGIKLITLGREAIEDGSRFGLNLVLAHESQRNGIVDDEQTQLLETANAVYAQLATSGALAAGWGAGSLSFEQQQRLDTLLRAQAGDWQDYARLLGSFDSSADYWKIVANRDAEGAIVSYSAIWDESCDLDLSDLGLGNVDLDTLDEEAMNALVADLEERGVTLDGRAITMGDVEAIHAVNTALTAFETSLTNADRDEFMTALQDLQDLGIISGNGRSYVNEAIASQGEGTYASPHAPIIGPLVETTSSGHRLTMLGLQPETGGGPGMLTSYNHVGADYRLRQDPLGQYFSMFGGTLALAPQDGSNGFTSYITDPGGNRQMIAHNSADTVWAFMNLWGSTAANLSDNSLTGVPAGSLIGSYGPSGNTTGAHLHMEVRNASGKNIDPSDYLDTAGYSIASAGPVVPVYSGYKIPGGDKAENREAYIRSAAFAEQFFGQLAGSLPRSFRDEMLVVMRANNLFASPGFAAMSADTVLPYLREWYPGAGAEEKSIMLEIARQHNPGGYDQWKELPWSTQQYVLPW